MHVDSTATVPEIKFLYAQFRGTITVKVALEHFLQMQKEVKKYVYEKLRIFFCSRAMRQSCTGFLSED